MHFEVKDIENKQRLKISNRADVVIRNDMISFHYANNISGFFNILLKNCSLMSEFTFSKNAESNNELYINKCKEKVNMFMEGRKKEKAYKFRLNCTNEKFFCNDDTFYEEIYYGKKGIGYYFNVLIEEYCSKSLMEREIIFFRDVLEKLDYAISNRSIVRLELKLFSYQEKKNIDSRTVFPICFTSDLSNFACSVVCAQYLDGNIELKREKLKTISIADIYKVDFELFSNDRSIYTDYLNNYLADIENAVDINNGTYKKIEKCYIKLSEKAIKYYEKEAYLRPLYTIMHDSQKKIFQFECAKSDMFKYFLPIAKEVIFLEPPYMQNEFKRYVLDNMLGSIKLNIAESFKEYCFQHEDEFV